MEHVILGIIANVIRTYTIYRFMKLMYLPKNNKYLTIMMYTIFIALTSGGYYLFYNFYINLFTNIFGLFLITLMYKGSIIKHILVSLSIYSINLLVESLAFTVVGLDIQVEQVMISVSECFTSIGIFVIVIILEKTKAIKSKHLHIGFLNWLALVSVPIISIGFILVILERHISNRDTTELEIVSILVINMIIFYLYGAIQDYYNQKIEKEEFLTRIKVYSNQLDAMKVSNEKTRELRHNMKHHIIELKYLTNHGDKQRTLDYLNAMENDFVYTNEYAASGNREIDGTINYLLQSANDILKDIDINIVIPENLEIHSYIFNIVLGNLLENAIKASVESDKKYLRVDLRCKQNVIFIKIENSFSGNLKVKNGLIETTKNSVEEHGIGLRSVKRMVDEMNGGMEVKWEKDIFYVDIMFYIGDSLNKK